MMAMILFASMSYPALPLSLSKALAVYSVMHLVSAWAHTALKKAPSIQNAEKSHSSPAAFSAGFFFLPETKAYTRRKLAEQGHASESLGLVSRSASVNGFDLEHPRRSVFGSFSSHKKETGVFRAHMIVSPLVAWHEVNDMWHELKDIVVHSLSRNMSRSTSYAR